MTILRIAAFSDGNEGGNPAGIWIGDDLPPASKMMLLSIPRIKDGLLSTFLRGRQRIYSEPNTTSTFMQLRDSSELVVMSTLHLPENLWLLLIICRYSLPSHIRDHVDYILPGVKHSASHSFSLLS